MLYAHTILAGRAEPTFDRHGGITLLKASSHVEGEHEGFLTGGGGHRGYLCGSSGKMKGEQMSFIQFIMALFGIGSNAGAQIDPHG